MFVGPEIVREMENRHGRPREEQMTVAMSRRELDFLTSNRRDGRAHDVTLYILEGRQVVVIRKPSYAADLFRTPSGGLHPGESFEAGTMREAREETGLDIAVKRYILRIKVDFVHDSERVPWTSHVFTACRTGGILCPEDTHEIVEARMISWEELKGPMRARLAAANNSGLRYRAELDRLAVEEIERQGLISLEQN